MNELKNKKILLVDDEKELLKMTESALRANGFFNIYTAQTCEEAAEAADAGEHIEKSYHLATPVS